MADNEGVGNVSVEVKNIGTNEEYYDEYALIVMIKKQMVKLIV